uniref:Acylneuraminate cytidylyltransferase n=1 Tax=Litorilinea aerophila TaxID=1204385 RepID=A0A540VHB4_9CHLR
MSLWVLSLPTQQKERLPVQTPPQTTFDAIILAGYDPDRPHPLTQGRGEPHKVLLPVAGRPMIGYVLQALADSGCVTSGVIVGMEPTAGLEFDLPVDYLPNRGSIFANAAAGFQHLAGRQDPRRHALLVSADVPLLTGEMVRWFVNACQPLDKDAYWGIVEKQVLERTFPHSRRTYLRLVEGQFCNGDLFLGRIEAALRQQALIRELVERRKNVLSQLRLLGPRVLLKFLLRRLSMADLIGVADRVLGLQGQPVILPFAEAGMDVDKPHHLAQVEAYLRSRGQQAAGGAAHG